MIVVVDEDRICDSRNLTADIDSVGRFQLAGGCDGDRQVSELRFFGAEMLRGLCSGKGLYALLHGNY